MKQISLQLCDISVHYDGVKALDGVDIFIGEGEIVALMGPNGAGKSTILKTIFGLTQAYTGKVLWRGKEIEPISHEVVRKGISFVPQGKRVFENLTVKENLEIGGLIIDNKKELKRRIEEITEIFPVLRQKQKSKAGILSGGQQQMLALARGLITEPRVLLLDEPSLGLAPKIVKEVFMKIEEINKNHKTAILVVEHNIKSLLNVATRGYVLDKGRVVAKGSSREIIESGILRKVFTGN